MFTSIECTETLLADINARRYSYVWHKYYGSTSPKPTFSHLKAKLLQSDKNQINISEETLVNVTTVTSLPQEPTPPLSLVSAAKSTDSYNPMPTPLQPLQCAMCGQPKSTHPSGCANYGVTCSACGVVGHNLIFRRKVIALKKSTSNPTRGNNNKIKKDHKNKKRRKSEDTSSSEEEKPIKNPKKVNMATHDLMNDSDVHVI
jgi:hypothetical protein